MCDFYTRTLCVLVTVLQSLAQTICTLSLTWSALPYIGIVAMRPLLVSSSCDVETIP